MPSISPVAWSRGTVVAAGALVAVVLTWSTADAQARHPVSGRVIAQVMGYEGAAWLERPERESEEQPSKAITALDIKPGEVVADVGAESGYYTVTGSIKEKPIEGIASGEIDLVVGTHALIQEGVVFKNLGLAIIDEQHRFGVMQRALLKKKAMNPDVLVMTATPIPRTLALTLYGDLDYSVIDELPPDRRPVTTLLFHEKQKESIYSLIREEVKKGRQVYVVYPVIEESEKTDLRSATTGKSGLEKLLPEFRTGLIHGRMKAQET